MKYEVLIFDADDTLFDFERAEKYALEHALSDHNITYDKEYHLPIYSTINEGIWKELERGEITQNELKTERFRRFLLKIQESVDPQCLSDSYIYHLSNASFLLPGSKELIESLKPFYRLVMVTNGITKVQENRICLSHLAPYFEDIIISESIKISKPDPEIFYYALRQINCTDKTKALMIGDSLTSDMRGGNNAGIDTCWYNPNHMENKTDVSVTYQVASYEELKSLLS